MNLDKLAKKYIDAGQGEFLAAHVKWCQSRGVEDLDTIFKIARARDFSVEGYAAFHELIYGFPLTEHMKLVIGKMMESSKNKRGTIVELFRGAAKTTSGNVGFVAWMIGLNPDKTFLMIQAGDDIALDNSSQIASIIEYNEGYHLAFPHVKPDKEEGWGAKGYEVVATHKDPWLQQPISYTRWRKMRAVRKDPTLVAMGYRSQIIGKRPWFLLMDDINDEKNTASERELRKVKTTLKGTIFPAANQSEWMVYIGTPWNESDALHYCLQTGEFDHIKIPVQSEDEDGKIIYTWPEMYGEKEVAKERAKAGEIEFARMFLLDLSKTKGLVLKKEWLHPFENQYINVDWPVYMGIDYTSTEDPRKERGDYFCIAIGREIPGGQGMVLEGGFRGKVSHAEAQDMVVAYVAMYPTLRAIGIEAIITGDLFYKDMLNNAEIRASGVVPMPVRFNKSKGYRFEKEMAPLFQRSRIRISDSENEFLTAFKDEWMNWQGDPLEQNYHNDTLDSVYAMLRAGENIVTPLRRERKLQGRNPFNSKEKAPNPFSLGR